MTSPGSSEGRVGAVLRLVRFPLVPTAVADSAAGYLIAAGSSWRTLVFLAAASGCFYMTGMALNDLLDRSRDKILHPTRPIPSGAIRPASAAILSMVLYATGLVSAWCAGAFAGGILLIAAILSYDALFKRWVVPGALAMGVCRALNLFLGTMAGLLQTLQALSRTGYREYGILIEDMLDSVLPPVLLGAYVAGVTLLSTMEEKHPGAAKWVAILLYGIIPLDAAMVAGSGRPLAALGILALLPLALGLKRFLPRHE